MWVQLRRIVLPPQVRPSEVTALLQGETLVARGEAATTTVAVAAPSVLVLPIRDEAIPDDPRPFPCGFLLLASVALVGIALRRGRGEVGVSASRAPQGVDAP